ncbi:MAG TPA: pseudouridine-5'-phosphate glycosidase [Kofleriaceae bacterium]|nr:pseudouridine-5'-phosphate glycosidase [Kofleriaceae bacterium]
MLEIAEEVSAALDAGGAVVALESTIIAHGLPFPENIATAHDMEAAVRAAGATPATIAIIDGVIRIGLGADELDRLARPGVGVLKAGASDLAAAMVARRTAATTVSATCVAAARVGIRVFATGGIGGVHLGDSSDVSSDLDTLARTPIAVVSSGVKAILDLPRTLERLESLGVLVIGFKTDELPGFFSRSTGLPLEHRMYRPIDVANAIRVRLALGQGGLLVANPIPVEAEIPRAQIEEWMDVAHADASRIGMRGKELTPFLLARIAGLSGGQTVVANRALAVSNATLGGAIAAALSAGGRGAMHPRLEDEDGSM